MDLPFLEELPMEAEGSCGGVALPGAGVRKEGGFVTLPGALFLVSDSQSPRPPLPSFLSPTLRHSRELLPVTTSKVEEVNDLLTVSIYCRD